MPDTDQQDGTGAAGFASGAAAGLSQVSGQLSGVQADAAAGKVTLSQEGALALLNSLSALRAKAADLVQFTADTLDQPLHLGHNWVGQTMDAKLRGAVVGHSGAVRPVLTHFQQVLDQVTATVRQASRLTTDTDAETSAALRRAHGQIEEA